MMAQNYHLMWYSSTKLFLKVPQLELLFYLNIEDVCIVVYRTVISARHTSWMYEEESTSIRFVQSAFNWWSTQINTENKYQYSHDTTRANLHTAATRCRHQRSIQGRDAETLVWVDDWRSTYIHPYRKKV